MVSGNKMRVKEARERIFREHITQYGADEPITYDNGKATLLTSLRNAYVAERVEIPVSLRESATVTAKQTDQDLHPEIESECERGYTI